MASAFAAHPYARRMSIVPSVKAKEIIAVLLKAGFKIVRQSGSHIRFQHKQDATRQTGVPYHNVDVPRWLVREIMRQAKISVKEFLKLLRT
ncbi:MAG: type II toxin-antitoxin system HicA family toxin [Patescibacteria group bacterium]